jgi:hypothetical protein
MRLPSIVYAPGFHDTNPSSSNRSGEGGSTSRSRIPRSRRAIQSGTLSPLGGFPAFLAVAVSNEGGLGPAGRSRRRVPAPRCAARSPRKAVAAIGEQGHAEMLSDPPFARSPVSATMPVNVMCLVGEQEGIGSDDARESTGANEGAPPPLSVCQGLRIKP